MATTTKYGYTTCCVDCYGNVEALQAMIDDARPVTYRTFMEHVSRADLESVFPSYEWRSPQMGLTLKRDWHVAYFKSSFEGRPCYYLVHSAIEYIFAEA